MQGQKDEAVQVGAATLSPRYLVTLHKFFLGFLVIYGAIVLFSPWGNPLELWDESRNANNAISMVLHGHWMVAYYDGAPDHWNTKPLLLTWLHATLMKLGVTPLLALRIPSALAATGCVLLIYRFCRNRLSLPVGAVLAGLLLMSSIRFFGFHVAISGDFDALLSLLIVSYCLSFWLYLEEGTSRWLVIGSACLTLAVLTKGIAGALPLPGLVLYASFRGKLTSTLRDRRLWSTLLVPVAVVSLFYASRERVDPGYLRDVWYNEVTGRYATVLEGHQHEPYFYLLVLLKGFEPGFVCLPLGVLLLSRRIEPSAKIRSAALMCVTVSVTVFCVLTTSKSKFIYYFAPMLPLLAIFCGIGLDRLRERALLEHLRWNRSIITVLTCFLVLTSGLALYHDEGSPRLGREIPEAHYGKTLAKMNGLGIRGPVTILDNGVRNNAGFSHYNPMPLFFAQQAALMGMSVSVQSTDRSLPMSGWVLTCDPTLRGVVGGLEVGTMKNLEVDGPCLYGRL
jgi:4-amino-4-deoxy-L-arabinose transferase-like glycosyltransferase